MKMDVLKNINIATEKMLETNLNERSPAEAFLPTIASAAAGAKEDGSGKKYRKCHGK